jgi:hypothetical protein
MNHDVSVTRMLFCRVEPISVIDAHDCVRDIDEQQPIIEGSSFADSSLSSE